ncbi:3726_t:CDS:2, partial [Funneliformis caledonium]
SEELQAHDLFEKIFSDFEIQVSLPDLMHKSLLKRIDELENLNSQEKNTIDELVYNQDQTGYKKKCLVCQTSNINNKKRIYPICCSKLPTIAKISQQSNELLEIINTIEKLLVIHSHTFKGSSKPQAGYTTNIYSRSNRN